MPPIAVPKDRTKREHTGRVDRVIFSDPDQPFVILALTDGLTVVGPFNADAFTPGTLYRWLGVWQDDDRRGPRFKASTFLVAHPGGKAGTVRYLSRAAEISEADARRLWDAFGDRAVATLRDDPEKARAATRLSADQAADAARLLKLDAATADTKCELFELFSGRGFHGTLVDACVKKWGVHAPRLIRRNPFALMPLGGGAGFRRCDRLWVDLHLPSGSPKRAVHVATKLVATDPAGHTWVSAPALAEKLLLLIPTASPKAAFKLALRARMLKRHRDAAGRLWLATYPRGTAEERVADSVRRLSASPSLWPADRVPVSARDGDRLPSEHQVERLRRATGGAVGMLLGGPGTGKTHSLAYLLREVVAEHGRSAICCCAPTGKAAVRMTQALQLAGLDLRAKTIHSTLEIGRNGHDGAGWGFQRNRSNPLDARFVVCDETSMNDCDLMADLLDACADGSNVLLIGDPGQLPPVGHGAPLRDLIAGGVPCGELTEVRRNAGMIVHACARIRNGEDFETADAADLDATPPRNLRLIEARDEQHAADLVERVLTGMTRFHPVWQTQVVVARNKKGAMSRVELNERLHPVLNPDGHAAAGNPFKVGDKVICLRNSRMQRVEPVAADLPAEMARDAGSYQVVYEVSEDTGARVPEEVYVANGEIGRVEAVGPKLAVARFSEGDMLVRIPIGRQSGGDDEGEGGEEKGRGCDFDHAYAITVHKAQGSEAPCVIVVGDENAAGLCNREWIYTAVSRASKLCILIGRKAVFRKMAGRVSLTRRKTFLAERLREASRDP